MPTEKLEIGNYYHIYNHAVGGRDLYHEPDNYEYFLGLYDKYISTVAETYAWCLMPNHFHLLVRIKGNIVYRYSNADGSIDAVRFKEVKWQTVGYNPTASDGPVGVEENKMKIPQPHLHFSHLFNAYSKYINKRYRTRGALFERPFKRKLINSDDYLKQVILYIHNNPVHHGFCEHAMDYPWSSYLTCVSIKPTKLHRNEVINWFGGEAAFKEKHDEKSASDEFDNWLDI